MKKNLIGTILSIFVLLLLYSYSIEKNKDNDDSLVNNQLVSKPEDDEESKKSRAVRVSFINLISNPGKYNGKWVRVFGVIDYDEFPVLVFTKDRVGIGDIPSVIYMYFDDEINNDREIIKSNCDGNYVLVEGKFKSGIDENPPYVLNNIRMLKLKKGRQLNK